MHCYVYNTCMLTCTGHITFAAKYCEVMTMTNLKTLLYLNCEVYVAKELLCVCMCLCVCHSVCVCVCLCRCMHNVLN